MRAPVLAGLVLLSLALAGCIGGDREPLEEPKDPKALVQAYCRDCPEGWSMTVLDLSQSNLETLPNRWTVSYFQRFEVSGPGLEVLQSRENAADKYAEFRVPAEVISIRGSARGTDAYPSDTLFVRILRGGEVVAAGSSTGGEVLHLDG